MRALFVAVPASGHVNPLLPLAQALLAQGHEVAMACGEDPGGAIARSGVQHLRAGGTEMAWFEVLRSRVRGFPGDGIAPDRINHYFVPRLFADIAAADMIDDVVEIGRKFAPDLVVFESYAFCGPLAAKVVGIPAVHHLISPMLGHEVNELADDALSPLWRSFGQDSPGWGGIYEGLTIEVSPASFEPLSVPGGESIRLRPAPLPLTSQGPQDSKVVYVTLGTFFNSNVEVFRTVLEALEGEDLELVVTVGANNDPATLGPFQGKTRVERYIPQAELLPRCSVVVHHGGSGTMFGALAHGLPQVILPQGADNFLNAQHVEGAGVGLAILPDSLNPAEVRRCVRAVLSDSSFARNAKELEHEFAAMPDADEVARFLAARFAR
ncbi:MAG: glycosyltransferase family 1 protein [Acidimicrobiales bacterium]|nr:glycosyltransferase family 1 protein [Acidimicrobiales bacterium]